MNRLARILSMLLCVAVAGIGVVELTGCGDDGPGASKPKKAGGKRRGRTKKAKAAKGGALQAYDKVPDEYRHKFVEGDFRADVTGEENRNPFRSYVINSSTKATEISASDITEICSKDNSVASNYSLRNLRLIGIVLRGTKSYALFRDTAAFGHIVRRGDCLGKEQARVETIGAGFVRLTVIPEAPPGAPAPSPQTRDIALYPEEMTLEPNEEAPQ
jgi:hypothetical protein